MPTVIHQLADAFLKRKQALSEGKRAKSVLPGSDYFMPKSAKEDLNNRLSVFEQGGLPELLKQGASEMYRNPIVNTAISLTPGAGDVQSGYEAVQSAKEGNWGEAGLNALGVLPFVPSMGMIGKTVWHGSPKIFDEFNLNLAKEGGSRSARGEGLYFSESPDFASSFRAAGGEGGNFGLEAGPTQGIANLLAYKGAKGEELARKYYPKLENIDEQIAMAKKAIDENSGLYKVDLPDEQIAKMIDYDLPLSQQSESVREALLKVNDPYINEALTTNPVYNEAGDYWSHMGNTYGSKNEALQDVMPANIISGQRGEFKSPQEISQRFYEAGIPGTQYAERGTRNYVVFSDKIPKILERNGTSVFEFPKD